ncbi:hypothetical protein AB6A40_006354 [Gnathostoma spinigerum]|uniref:Uncharacterized protein n=1 Tax=Gnathostoma spinigerum TaxID=75299 RepID=A0ABD6EJB4_9BILA
MFESIRDTVCNLAHIENFLARRLLAEFIGTFFLLLIGTSANVQHALDGSSLISPQIAWGIGFAFAVLCAANTSGAHLNPAISFTALLFRDLTVLEFALYALVQIFGAFVGTAVAFLCHFDDIVKLGNGTLEVIGPSATAGLFATFPTAHISVVGSFFDELIGTAILAGVISLIFDDRQCVEISVKPLMCGLTMTMIAMSFGSNGGFAINPARDLGPRIFLLIAGYGWSIFSAHNWYFWIPLVAPMIGAFVGTSTYKLFIGMHGLEESVDISTSSYPRGTRISRIGDDIQYPKY